MHDRPTGWVFIDDKAELRLEAGHRWVYDRDVASMDGAPEAGDVVGVVTRGKREVGLGLYSPRSRIRVRLLTTANEPIREEFWASRLRAAIVLRTPISQEFFSALHAAREGLHHQRIAVAIDDETG